MDERISRDIGKMKENRNQLLVSDPLEYPLLTGIMVNPGKIICPVT